MRKSGAWEEIFTLGCLTAAAAIETGLKRCGGEVLLGAVANE
jgi:hypothetical protein